MTMRPSLLSRACALMLPALGLVACTLGGSAPVSALDAHPGHDVLIADSAVFPESLSADAKGALYVGSLKGVIYRAAPGAAEAAAWIRPDAENGLLWVLGVLADDASNTLWVCSSPAAFRTPPALGTSAVVAFDLATGKLKARYPLPEPAASACNDIAVASDGTLFATETTNARIFMLKPGAKNLSLFVQDAEQLTGVDGIAFAGDGTLYVNNVRKNSMFRVERKADGSFAALKPLAISAPLNGPDGLRPLGGNRFLQGEGPAGRVSELVIEGDNVTVREVRSGLEGAPGVTHVGDTAYAIEGKISYLFDPKLKGQDPGSFYMRAIPLGGQ